MGAPAAATQPAHVNPSPFVFPTTAPPGARGAIELSGSVQGFLAILSATCLRQGSGVAVAVRGRVENVLYGVDVQAGAMGAFDLGAVAAGTLLAVQLNNQSLSETMVRRWGSGVGGSRGSGTLNLSADGGSIDADLRGFGGTTGTVHLRGSWTCG